MNEPDDIPARVTRLEHQMIQARGDAAAARVLAGGADRDVSLMQDELRAHTRSLNALRETQAEHGHMLTDHGQRLDRLERKVDNGFQQVDDRFKQVDANFQRVDANFRQIDANFRTVDANFRTVEGEFSKLNTGMAHITALLTNKLNEPDDED